MRETDIDFLRSYKKQLNNDWFVSVKAGGNQMQRKNHFHAVTANKLLIPEVQEPDSGHPPAALFRQNSGSR